MRPLVDVVWDSTLTQIQVPLKKFTKGLKNHSWKGVFNLYNDALHIYIEQSDTTKLEVNFHHNQFQPNKVQIHLWR